METRHSSQPSLRWETPVLLLILCGVAVWLWYLSGGHFPPASWRDMGTILPNLPRLWMNYGLHILPLLILLVIEASELPIALIFFGISTGILLRMFCQKGASREVSNEDPALAQRNPLRGSQIPGEVPLGLMIATRTYSPGSTNGNTPPIRASLVSNGQRGLKLCGVFALVDGRASAELEAAEACFLVSQVLRDLLQGIPSEPIKGSDTYKQLLIRTLEQANSRLFQQNQHHGTTLRATVTCMIVLAQVTYIAHIGSNRAYLYREQEGLYQLTTDHGSLLTGDASRQLGVTDQALCDVMTVSLHEKDVLLLCSDEVWEAVSDVRLEQIIASRDEEPHMAEKIVQAIQQHSGNTWASLILAHLVSLTGQ